MKEFDLKLLFNFSSFSPRLHSTFSVPMIKINEYHTQIFFLCQANLTFQWLRDGEEVLTDIPGTYTKEDEPVAYCSLWYDNQTDYAYLEPVCTVPEHRHKGLAKAIIYEALNRVKELGAKKVYVLSDQEFYKKIGMKFEKHFTFYWKKENE